MKSLAANHAARMRPQEKQRTAAREMLGAPMFEDQYEAWANGEPPKWFRPPSRQEPVPPPTLMDGLNEIRWRIAAAWDILRNADENWIDLR